MEWNRTTWNAIFYSSALHIDGKDRNKVLSGHTTTKELLVEHKEYGENMRSSRARAAMDVWLELIAAGLKKCQWFLKAMRLPKTVTKYLLTREGLPAQTDTIPSMSKIGVLHPS